MFNFAKLLLLIGDLADDSMSDCSSECSEASYMSDLDDHSKSINFDFSNGSPIDKNNFNVVHYNINSILAPGKLYQLSEDSVWQNVNFKHK